MLVTRCLSQAPKSKYAKILLFADPAVTSYSVLLAKYLAFRGRFVTMKRKGVKKGGTEGKGTCGRRKEQVGAER